MVTDNEVLTELLRERAMRANVYPRLVNDGKLTHEDAHLRMEVIARLILEYEKRCNPSGDLFALDAGASAQAPKHPLQRPDPGARDGKPGAWQGVPEDLRHSLLCPECKSPLLQWREVEFTDIDYVQLMCLNTQCYHVWWVAALGD